MKVLKYFIIICLLMGMTHSSYAATGVPHRVHFQSVFYDSGGNPLTSGQYQARFSILDQSDQPLYVEEQQIELANGVASMMVGDGFKEGSNLSSPAGGIPVNVLNPTQNYFLKVELKGASELSPLQIASVPFSFYSERALSVSPGSILAESLAQGIIERDHLSKALQDAIFGSIGSDRLPSSVVTKEEFLNHVNAMSGAHRAEAISITNPAFANSRSTNVAGVLKDLDVALEFRRHDLDAKTSNLQDQITANTTNLQNQITQENQSRIQSDGNLQSQINASTTDLQNQISTKVSKSGDTMSGTLNMGGNRIVNVSDPAADADASTKRYVDQAVNAVAARIPLPNPSGNVGTQPQVVAAGVVWNQNPSGALSTRLNLLSSYGVSKVVTSVSIDDTPEEVTGPPSSVVIYFSSPIATPYIVLLSPVFFNQFNDLYSTLPQTASVTVAGPVFAHSMTTTRFVVSPQCASSFTGDCLWNAFHFVVYK